MLKAMIIVGTLSVAAQAWAKAELGSTQTEANSTELRRCVEGQCDSHVCTTAFNINPSAIREQVGNLLKTAEATKPSQPADSHKIREN